MDGKAPESKARFFSASLPYTQEMWIGWSFGALLYIIGFIFSPFLALLGLLLLFLNTPHPFAQELEHFKKKVTDYPFLRNYAKERGLSVEKYWLPNSLDGLENNAGEWHFPTPSKYTWNRKEPYVEDQDGSLLFEHPFMVGPPRPSLLTHRAVYFTLGLLMLQFWGVVSVFKYHLDTFVSLFVFLIEFTSSQTLGFLFVTAALIVTSYYVIWFFILLTKSVTNVQMVDMQTSLVSSVPVGEAELVGQVRPGPNGALKLFVDDNPKMSCENIVCYEWVREDFPQQGEMPIWATKNFFLFTVGKISVQLKAFYRKLFALVKPHTHESARQSGGLPFILHDGSGGIRVEPSMFRRIQYQVPLNVWDVGSTRWTLYGLRLGDPLYIYGEVTSRPQEEIAEEKLDGTLDHSLLKVIGNEDPPNRELILIQGTEYSMVPYAYSMMETLYLPVFYLTVFFILGIV
tara:strand:- start:790 stop:2163 length:1374 start_codon:yes stop_codon:yes gene_type:complete